MADAKHEAMDVAQILLLLPARDRSQIVALARYLAIVEAPTYREALLVEDPHGWTAICADGVHLGGAGYTRLEAEAEVDGYLSLLAADGTDECLECDGTGRAYGKHDGGYARWGDCPCCDGTGIA